MTRTRALLTGLTAGLLMSGAYHPLDAGLLAWIAPALLGIALAHPAPRPWLTGAAFGVAFQAAGLHWITYTTGLGYAIAVAIHGALFAPVAALACAARRRGLPLWLTLPPAWLAAEYVRGELLLGGFTWLLAGHSQWRFPHVQVADIGGTWLVGWLVLLGAGAIAELAAAHVHPDTARSRRQQHTGAAIATLGLLAAFGYGGWRLSQTTMTDGPRVGLIQASIPQAVKNRMRRRRTIIEPHVGLTRRLRTADPAPAMIVWPETMLPGCPHTEPEMRDIVRALAIDVGRPVLVGHTRFAPGPTPDSPWRHFNSLLMVGADGAFGTRYAKRRLVQAGEYIPLRDLMPWIPVVINNMVGYVPDVAPGGDPSLFEIDGVPFGVVICNESTFPGLSRAWRQAGARFIVNPTNDAWFHDSAELDQVVAICTLRAVENRVGIVRAANNGISCFIDPDGRVRSRLEVNGVAKNAIGTHVDVVRLDDRRPLALTLGDAFAYLALLVVAALLVHLRRTPA